MIGSRYLVHIRGTPKLGAKLIAGALLSALVLGWRFGFGTIEQGVLFQIFLGYWWMWLLLGVLVWSSVRLLRIYPISWSSTQVRLWNERWVIVFIFACSVFLHVHEPHEFKVLYDEPSHLTVSGVMHAHRQSLSAARSHYVGDSFVLMNTYPQFRQGFYPFLLSLGHDLFGYSPKAPFILNATFGLLLLSLCYATGAVLWGRNAGILAVLLITAVPLLAQNVTSAGYDVANLAFLAAALLAGILFVREKNLVLASRILDVTAAMSLVAAQIRYESILYLGYTGLLIGVRLMVRRELVCTWLLVFAPVLLLPAFASNLYFLNTDAYQLSGLRKAGEAFFGPEHIPGHLQDLLVYLFSFGSTASNSILVSIAGVIGLSFIWIRVFTERRVLRGEGTEGMVFATFSAAVFCVYVVTLMNFWSSPLDGLAARFTLPFWYCLALAGSYFLVELSKWRPLLPGCYCLIIWSLIANTARANSTHESTSLMTPSRSERWFMQFAEQQERETTLFVSKSNMQLMGYRFASIDLDRLNRVPEKVVLAMKAGLYKSVYILERTERFTARATPPADRTLVGENLVVEEIDSRSFAPGQLARILRFTGYRDTDGAVITPDNAPDLRSTFKSEADRDAYILSLYP